MIRQYHKTEYVAAPKLNFSEAKTDLEGSGMTKADEQTVYTF